MSTDTHHTQRHRTASGAPRQPSIMPRQDCILPPTDPAMKLVEEQALQVASSDETVLLLGETGVGKDVTARRIHDASPRAAGRFVQINCAALPDGLLESELFGHVRGAYTGAVDSQPGQFEMASRGTIFLDEIGEMSPRLQAKLLHVLQERRFCRVGGREPIEVDVRVIAATNQDLDQAMIRGTFRRDLYYRLCVVCLRIPSLRERPGDIEGLARFFALKYSSLYNKPALAHVGDDVIALMRTHPFEGNVRELENLIKRAILLGGYDRILADLAPAADLVPAAAPHAVPAVPAGSQVPLKEITRRAVEEAEREAILQALSTTRWNRRRAAQLLKISYRSMLYKIRDYAIMQTGTSVHDLIAHEGGSVVSPREGSS